MLTQNELKSYLLKIDLVENNSYLDEYCFLIESNLNRQKEKFKTHKHHFIPVAYYKNLHKCQNRIEAEKYSTEDPNNILVNLLYCDHVLAHCMLSFCIKDKVLKDGMIASVIRLTNAYNVNLTDLEKNFIKNSDLYQKIYELNAQKYVQFNPMKNPHLKLKHDLTMAKSTTRSKISSGMKKSRKEDNKKIHIYKDRKQIRVSENELPTYLRDGWKKGNPKGMMYIHLNKVTKKIWPEEFEVYKTLGWEIGKYCLRTIHDEEERKLYKQEVCSKINKSKPKNFNKSESFREAQSKRLYNYYKNNPNFKTKSKKANRLFNDKEEHIFDTVKELEKYINITPGKGKLSTSFKEGKILLKNNKYYGWNIEFYNTDN